MIWALAVTLMGAASIWLGLQTFEEFRDAFKSDPRATLSWDMLVAAIFNGDGSSTYGLTLLLLGLVFVLVGVVFVIVELVTLAL